MKVRATVSFCGVVTMANYAEILGVTMKSYEAYNAYQAVKKMADCLNIPFKTRIELVCAKKVLENVAIAYAHAEKAVAEKYADRDDNGAIKIVDGCFNVTDDSKKILACDEISKLRNETVLFDFQKVQLNPQWCNNSDLSASEIESLVCVIEFVTGDENNGTL